MGEELIAKIAESFTNKMHAKDADHKLEIENLVKDQKKDNKSVYDKLDVIIERTVPRWVFGTFSTLVVLALVGLLNMRNVDSGKIATNEAKLEYQVAFKTELIDLKVVTNNHYIELVNSMKEIKSLIK